MKLSIGDVGIFDSTGAISEAGVKRLAVSKALKLSIGDVGIFDSTGATSEAGVEITYIQSFT